MEFSTGPRALSLLTAFALAIVACKPRPPAPPKPVEPLAPAAAEMRPPAADQQWVWTARSADGTASVEQRLLSPGHCVVEGRGGAEPWTVEECRGDAIKLHFVSADGRGLLVIDALPEKGSDWGAPMVVSLYTLGKPTAQTNAAALLENPGHLRKFSSRYAWLQGTGGLPGVGPHYLDAQLVEATTVNNRVLKLGFTAPEIPPAVLRPVEAQGSAPALKCSGMLEWSDASGETHYTDSLGEVPEPFRKRVKCTAGGEIAVVAAVDHPRPVAVAAPGQPAPQLIVVPNPTQVYCSYTNLQKREGGLDIAFPGAGVRSNHSFCAPGTIAEAAARCERDAKARFPDPSPCSCTADKATVASRCN